jgi:hypothetical protein
MEVKAFWVIFKCVWDESILELHVDIAPIREGDSYKNEKAMIRATKAHILK